jgi:predicted metal-dependent hydrolase
MYWNHTPLLSWIYDSFSMLLPAAETFVSRVALAGAAGDVPDELGSALRALADDEHTHLRAHQAYNRRLDALGYDASARAASIQRSLDALTAHLGFERQMALASALEQLAVRIGHLTIRSDRWVPDDGSPQASLWRWHAREEIAHGRAALSLERLRVRPVARWSMVPLAWALVLFHLLAGVVHCARIDLGRGRVGVRVLLASVLDLGARIRGELFRSATHPSSAQARVTVRFLSPSDIDELRTLELARWEPEQAATPETLARRIAAHPRHCVGAFCVRTGRVVASLFMKPARAEVILAAPTWEEIAAVGIDPVGGRCDTVFGISLTSADHEAVRAMVAFYWPHALCAGHRRVILSSPMPGLARHVSASPGACPDAYARTRRRGGPVDPQLRFYERLGFRRLLAVKSGYFPHRSSLDHSALLEGRVPFGSLSALWSRCPGWFVGAVCRMVASIGGAFTQSPARRTIRD